MPKADRLRVDYMPCQAAIEALKAAQELYPEANTQALIDRLVITGLSALVHGSWQPPSLWGQRDHWKMPANLRERIPGDSQ
jgi:hypothetical protein